MVEILEEIKEVCADLAGVNSLFDAMINGDYSHPDALRILGGDLCDVYRHLEALMNDWEEIKD